MARRKPADTWTTERPSTIEMVGRMLVPSSYRVPVEGRSSRPGLQSTDIAGALAMLADPLQRETAIAVVTRAPRSEIAKLAVMAYHRVAHAVRCMPGRPLVLSKPEDRFRLRIVIYHAANELVWPEHRRTFAEMAKEAKMRKSSYADVWKVAAAELEAALSDAGLNLKGKLG